MHHRLASSAAILLLPWLAAACSEDARVDDSDWAGTAAAPRIYRLEGTLTDRVDGTPLPANPWPFGPAASDLYVRVFPAGHGWGSLRITGPTTRADVPYHLERGVLVVDADVPYSVVGNCSSGSLALEDLVLSGDDEDGDGTVDRITATAHGSGHWVTGDVGGFSSVDAAFVGTLHTAGLVVPLASAAPRHPLAPLGFDLDLPVTRAPIDLVDAMSGAVVADDAWVGDGAGGTTHAFAYAGPPLPWGASLRTDTTGIVDERGLALGDASLTVMEAPGLFDTPTFEGTVHAVLEQSTLTPTAQWFPSFEGAQALEMREFGRTTVEVDGTARSTLVLSMRVAGAYLPIVGGDDLLDVTFFDAAGVDALTVPAPELVYPTGGGPSDLFTLRIPLPPRATGGVVGLSLEPARRVAYWCGPVGPTVLLVESLTLE